MKKKLHNITLFYSYIKTLIHFYILRRFRNLNEEQIEFLKGHFKPENKRDLNLMDIIIKYNNKRLK